MPRTRRHLALMVCSAALLGACQTSSGPDDSPESIADDVRRGEEVSSVCFASTIDSFQDATRDTVVIEKGNDHYLVEVFGSCFNLRRAQSIALDSSSSCLRRGDSLIVSESVFGFSDDTGMGVSRCAVTRIYEWDPKATDGENDETPAED